MNKGEISPRVKSIILILCAQKNFMTIRAIAVKLSVSTKTVIRDLPEIEKLIGKYHAHLDKKQGVGICLQGSEDVLIRIKAAFDTAPEKLIYQPKERSTFLTARLLQNQAPIKLFELSTELNVAESTISSDLDKLEDWFIKHKLILIRKPGLGVYVSGSEKNIRKAILHCIYENIDEKSLVSILHDTLSRKHDVKNLVDQSSQRLLNLVDTHVLHRLETVLRQIETKDSFKLSDNAYVGLLIHLALAIQRMGQNEKISFDDSFLKQLSGKKEFTISKQIALSIEKMFSISVPREEIGYIAMHLLGTRNEYYTGSTPFIPNFQLVQLAKKIIKTAQAETGQKLENNEKLLIGLVNHLGPSISRLKMGMEIRNPLLSDIKKDYAQLMQLSRICCTPLYKIVGPHIPDSEVAYIAMHLGAALEDTKHTSQTKYHVAIACPTGLGSSKLLASRIKHEFNRIHIVDIISALRLDSNKLSKENIDFIISTVPIPDASLPVLVVNALLRSEDIHSINKFLLVCKSSSKNIRSASKEQLPFQDALLQLTHYQTAIFDILNKFIFIDETGPIHVNDLIKKIGSLLSDDNADDAVTQAIWEREKYGSTFLYDQKIMLLHCRAPVSSSRLSIARIENGFSHTDASVKLTAAVALVIPINGYQENAETMGAITEAMAENWLFSSTITNGTKNDILKALETILKSFLQKKINLLLT
ncbi:BglG family transcription antiterminator [Pectinatus haikarae]|uniref:Mannitol operon transcriptional antiterminator n=1 Tax=Pectinatus haikarae TaxID=349096 RepID=A0ABT9YAI9_9FIRM|nr:BglG family transcription antiterminator [Pectinatus haikarae]MDQ0204858.1 mannitol operon transcriptional antiterminator [Pectinatus haikarae]